MKLEKTGRENKDLALQEPSFGLSSDTGGQSREQGGITFYNFLQLLYGGFIILFGESVSCGSGTSRL